MPVRDDPRPLTRPRQCDVVVIGSGLGGMMAANRLQSEGRRVVLLERHDHPGGRCGAFSAGGYSFTRGCNEFAGGMARALAELGAAVQFKPASTLLNLGDAWYRLPPDFSTAARLIWQAPALTRLVLAVRKHSDADLGTILARRVKNPQVEGIASVLAYANGVPPSGIDTRELAAEFSPKLGYEHSRQMVPIGGAQAITDALIERFEAAGGELVLGADCHKALSVGKQQLVQTSRGSWLADRVITSQSHRVLRGRHLKRGLAASQFLLVLPHDFPVIEERAFVHMPLDAEGWLGALDRGHMPERFGFHFFQDQLTATHRTLTGFCLLPRGEDDPSAERRKQVMDYIFERTEARMPGFRDAVLFQRFLGPHDYIAQHGVRSELSRVVADPDWQTPDQVDEEQRLIHVGNGMSAPGQHATAALFSGSLAADAVLAAT